jgi:hypothetical protein
MKFVILVHRWRQSYAEVYTKDTKLKKRRKIQRFKKGQYFKKKRQGNEITKQAGKTVSLNEGRIQCIGTGPESS